MGKGKQLRRKFIQLHKQAYDVLYRKDPGSANMYLLVLEVEHYYATKGVTTSLVNLQASTEALGAFMDRNKNALQGLFTYRFPDPLAYSFTGNLDNDKFLEPAIEGKIWRSLCPARRSVRSGSN